MSLIKLFIVSIVILFFYSFHASVRKWYLTGVWVTTSLFKSPWIFLCILADLRNAVVWMDCIPSLIYKSSSSFTNTYVIVPRASIIIGITVTTVFSFPSGTVFISLFTFLQFHPEVSLNGKSHHSADSLFCLFAITRFGRLAKIKWSVFISKYQKTLCVSHVPDEF